MSGPASLIVALSSARLAERLRPADYALLVNATRGRAVVDGLAILTHQVRHQYARMAAADHPRVAPHRRGMGHGARPVRHAHIHDGTPATGSGSG
jgi:hypothetical protein